MVRFLTMLVSATFLLSACDTPTPTLTPDGRPAPKLYRISAADKDHVQFRMLDAVNALRQAAGRSGVILNAQLNAAAATHSRDMAVQNRPWHFGSDGSSPIERVQRTGYTQSMLGENISETYETELETLGAWMDEADTRAVILDPGAVDLGFSWYQERSGKIWWTLVMGGGGAQVVPQPAPQAERTQG